MASSDIHSLARQYLFTKTGETVDYIFILTAQGYALLSSSRLSQGIHQSATLVYCKHNQCWVTRKTHELRVNIQEKNFFNYKHRKFNTWLNTERSVKVNTTGERGREGVIHILDSKYEMETSLQTYNLISRLHSINEVVQKYHLFRSWQPSRWNFPRTFL